MNLRTLKKLSKRAAPLLPLLGDSRGQFPAGRDDSYITTLIADRKHWERSPCSPGYEPRNDYSTPRGAAVKHLTRAGRTIVIRPPGQPRKGTIMVGAMSGYYEPEWSEAAAWEALRDLVYDEFTEWGEDYARPLREFRGPRDILQAAGEMIARAEAE